MPTQLSRAAAQARLVELGLAPRGLSLDLAAAYVGLSPACFLAEVAAGRYPQPSRHGRTGSRKAQRRVWDREALDRAMSRLSGLEPDDEAPATAPDEAAVQARMMEAIDDA